MINYIHVEKLPVLAFLTEIDNNKITCWAGEKVNFDKKNNLIFSGTVSYFTENGLNGDITNLSNIYFGSGFKENNGGLIVFTPSHFTEHCFFF